MSGVTVDEMKSAARDLRDAIAEHDRLCVLLGGDGDPTSGLEAVYRKARLNAHANSTSVFGKQRTVAEHETAAELGAFNEWAEWNAASYGLKACKERMHSLRQILSAFQTQTRIEAEFTGRGA